MNINPYENVRDKKIKLKGKNHHKHKSHKKHKSSHKKNEDTETDQFDEDILRHGGWWETTQFSEITGNIAIEISAMKYIKSEDTGLFSQGSTHDPGESPAEEEMLMAMRVGDDKIALKSGFDKYISVDHRGLVVGRSDAIGPKEHWTPVFEKGMAALLGANGCFIGCDSEGRICCNSETVGENEILKIRSCAQKFKKIKIDKIDETKNAKDLEINYVKHYQSFQDRRLRVNDESKSDIKKARKEGTVHETLLNRREKMKSDRYCK